jgi:hypothetical protein
MERATRGKEWPSSTQSCSLRAFFRLRLRANASLTRSFSPGFQVKGVTFDFFNDVFLLYLTFEAAQRILKGLALLNPNFSQLTTPPN